MKTLRDKVLETIARDAESMSDDLAEIVAIRGREILSRLPVGHVKC